MKKGSMWIAAGFWGIGLAVFYLRYVPLVPAFQAALVPFLVLVCVTTAVRPRWGIPVFIFLFPLINNLPYVFGIHEPLPHAPAALVLFLFFFWGWLVHHAAGGELPDLRRPVFRPLSLFAAIVGVSGLITFWKYANFVPFRSDAVYELVVNVEGVTAGGALMSTVFFALNYLTGIAFFAVLAGAIRTREFARRIALVLLAATVLSLAFGLYQRFGDLTFANNPISIAEGLINATFKDALSFGMHLAAVMPLILGAMVSCGAVARLFGAAAAGLSFYMIFHTGSRSALVCLAAATAVFLGLSVMRIFALQKARSPDLRKTLTAAGVVVLAVALAAAGLVVLKDDILSSATVARWERLMKRDSVRAMMVDRVDGLWAAAGHMIREYPATGVGIGGYIIEVSNFAREYDISMDRFQSAENHLLQTAAELGIAGAFLVLWIFLEILKQMRRSLRNVSAGDPNAHILLGAIAGLSAFFLNFQVHTYIGSYEIKYLFWLLAALIFFPGRGNGGPETGVRPRKPGSKAWIPGMILVAAFAAGHLWNSTRSLSIRAAGERFGIERTFGFHDWETAYDGREFRWMGSYGGQSLTVEEPRVAIALHAAHPDAAARPVAVRVYVVRDMFRTMDFVEEIVLASNRWVDRELHLPAAAGEEVILLFKVSRTWSPLKTLGIPDARNLGVALSAPWLTDPAGNEADGSGGGVR